MKIGAILGGIELSKCETCHALVLTQDERRHEYWHEDLNDSLTPEYRSE